MAKVAAIFLILVMIVSCKDKGLDFSEVILLDESFEIVRKIEDEKSLKEFMSHWEELESVSVLPDTNWTHKIDIKSSGEFSGRWLYNTKGYMARLNKLLAPKYKVSNAVEFNEFLFEKYL